jgi:hypothetical protein
VVNGRRIFIMLLIVTLFAVAYWLLRPASNRPLAPSPIGTPLATSVSIPTPPAPATLTSSSVWERTLRPAEVITTANRFETTWVAAVVAVGKVLLAILIGLAALILIAVLIEAIFFHPRQLVMTNVTNASGEKEIDGMLPGISQRMREQLREETEWMTKIAGWYGGQHAPGIELDSKMPAPNEKVAAEIADFLKSMSDVGGSQVKLLGKTAGLLFKQSGTQTACTLQVTEKDRDKIGVTVQISDIAAGAVLAIKTFSEADYRALGDPRDLLRPCPGTDLEHSTVHLEQHKATQAAAEPSRALLDRYNELCAPALRWLTLELFRQELQARRPAGLSPEDKQQYDAKVCNFLGALYLSSAISTGATLHGLFFRSAFVDLTCAQDFWEEWFIPHENLGDYFYVRGLYDEPSCAAERFAQAACHYDMALQKLAPQILLGRASVQDDLRLCAEKAIVLILSGTCDSLRSAHEMIHALDRRLTENVEEWSRSATLLYTLATLYALAERYELEVPDASAKAFRYVAAALARDGRRNHYERLYWSQARHDEMLKCLQAKLPGLMDELNRELIANPGIPSLGAATGTQKSFFDHVDAVIEGANRPKEERDG